MGVHADSRAFRTLNPGESPAQPPPSLFSARLQAGGPYSSWAGLLVSARASH